MSISRGLPPLLALMVSCGGVQGAGDLLQPDLHDVAASDVEFDAGLDTLSWDAAEVRSELPADDLVQDLSDSATADTTEHDVPEVAADDISDSDVPDADVVFPACPAIGDVVSYKHLNLERVLGEASGLVASRSRPGILWSHNDSGSDPILYEIDLNLPGDGSGGAPVRKVALPEGTPALDWEDIAIGPFLQGSGDYIFIADTGDNYAGQDDMERARTSVRILAMPEPGSGGKVAPESVLAVEARYPDPDGPRDCEAMFVDPLDGGIYLVEKEWSGEDSRVYRLDPSAFLTAGPAMPELKFVGEIPGMMMVTGADMSADGRWLAVRNYFSARLLGRTDNMTVAEMLADPGCYSVQNIGFNSEPWSECQGESIAFAQEASGFYTVSEFTSSFCDVPESDRQDIHFTPLSWPSPADALRQ